MKTEEKTPTIENQSVLFEGDVGALFTALAAAQAEMEAAKRSSTNPHFRSKYADISAVLEAGVPALTNHGICLVQLPGRVVDGLVELTTILGHSAGGRIISTAACPVGRGDGPQAYGSAITYLRRYCGQAAMALPAEDDDGEKAQASFRTKKGAVSAKAAKLEEVKHRRTKSRNGTPTPKNGTPPSPPSPPSPPDDETGDVLAERMTGCAKHGDWDGLFRLASECQDLPQGPRRAMLRLKFSEAKALCLTNMEDQ